MNFTGMDCVNVNAFLLNVYEIVVNKLLGLCSFMLNQDS